jgi:hypothetical protein
LKRAAHIIILLIFLVQSAGIMVYYQLQQIAVQQRMKEALESDNANLECLTLLRSEYEKSRVGRNEISLDGMMYGSKRLRRQSKSVRAYRFRRAGFAQQH